MNDYESKAYAALLELDTATAADISKKAGIPRARVYDVLVGLEKKGFLIQRPTRPIQFNAFHPVTALKNLEKTKKENFASELEQLNGLKEELAKHATQVKRARLQGETAYLISGNSNIEAKMQELFKGAKEEAVICTNSENAIRKAGLLQKVLKASPTTAAVKFFTNSTIDLKQHYPALENVEFNKIENACRLMVFDNKKALMFLNHQPSDEEKALLIESPHVARYLKETIR